MHEYSNPDPKEPKTPPTRPHHLARNNARNNARKSLGYALDAFHFIILFFPLLLFLIPPSSARSWLKYVFPLYILVPLHWGLLDNQCLFTLWSIQLGSMQHQGHDSSFSDTYLRWLYKPLIALTGNEYSASTLDKAIYIHWGINFLLISLYAFGFVYSC